jgi:hypothetical protein
MSAPAGSSGASAIAVRVHAARLIRPANVGFGVVQPRACGRRGIRRLPTIGIIHQPRRGPAVLDPIPRLLAAVFAAALLPAAAATFDFANLEYNNGANTGFLPSDGISCTGGDLCSSNVDGNIRNGHLTFTSGALTVLASGLYNGGAAAVVQDHENGYSPANKIGAGLGVYHLTGDSSDDNVTPGETLVLTFDQVVNLTSISLRSDGHNLAGWTAGDTFVFNGTNTLLPVATGSIAVNRTGTQFTFAYGGKQADQFYVSGVTAVAAVPEPETYALMLAGLTVVGFVAARRRRTA